VARQGTGDRPSVEVRGGEVWVEEEIFGEYQEESALDKKGVICHMKCNGGLLPCSH